MTRRLILFALVALPLFAQPDPESESWIDSPEAYYATNEEREEWRQLHTRGEREAFKNRYWLKRDPTPGTEANEFRETILGRIKTADKRFRLGKIAGSRTARGFVFVVFGSPARVSSDYAPPLTPPRVPTPGAPAGPPVGVHEGNEVRETWLYDPQRTPRVLQALNRPSLELTFVVEPTRRRDRLQNPGLAHDYRDILAEKSIVNLELVAGRRTSPRQPSFTPASEPTAELKAALQADAATSNASFGQLVVWPETGSGRVMVWFAVPADGEQDLKNPTLRAALRSGAAVTYFSAPGVASRHFFTSRPSKVFAAQLDVPPGEYTATFALTSDGRVVATAKSPLQIPDLSKEFSVSSILLTGGANPAPSETNSPFRFGSALLEPRADASYLRSESLWYFIEVANPSSAAEVTVKTNLRRPGAPFAVSGPSPAQLQQIAPGRYVTGFEIPLSHLEPGEYTLYATLTDPGRGAEVVKRADFRILPD